MGTFVMMFFSMFASSLLLPVLSSDAGLGLVGMASRRSDIWF